MRQANPPVRKALLTVLTVLLLATPALGVIHPRLLDWQARLSRMLPEGARLQAARASDDLPVTATPAELQQALGEVAPGLPRVPLELFSGLRLLQRREATLVGFDERLQLYARSHDLLTRYCRDTHEALRLAPPGPDGSAGAPLAEPEAGRFEPQTSPQGLVVLRELPAPHPGLPRARLRRLRLAATQDLQEVARRRVATEKARAVFLDSTLVWRRHLYRLAESLSPTSGLPCPTQEALPEGAWPLVEQVPPPPPLDLPELREDPAFPRAEP